MHDVHNILLDRDGTVIRERHYLSSPEQVELLPGVARSLQRLSLAGFHLFLLSNQSGIGRGYFTESDRKMVDRRLESLLVPYRVAFRGKLHCPHTPRDGCTCRKPRTGMWSVLQREFGLRAEQSLMVGDKMSDVGFGKNAGLAATVLLLTGHGADEARDWGIPEPSGPWREEGESRPGEWPDVIARDLDAFRAWLLRG
ncbi:MAG: HAD family hydrolase [Desulfohalobiaceae bacterium]|nr:HAD family hydrolase [Desulfohalobiaceae bacterium]MCF8085382.1 HAD family hydrolase [Desulfohalobiaceae bacterium]